jgi:uncharacterized protein YcfL
MKNIILFAISISLFLGLSGCGASNKNIVKEKKSTVNEDLLYEEFKAKKARERLNEELSK